MADGLELIATKAERDILKWMFVFWLGQIFATLAIVVKFSMK